MKITDDTKIKIGDKTVKIKNIKQEDMINNAIVKIDDGMIIHPLAAKIGRMLLFIFFFFFLFLSILIFICATFQLIKGKANWIDFCMICVFLFIFMPYLGFYTFAGRGMGPVFVGDGWFAFPDYGSLLDSKGIPYKYGIYVIGNFDIQYSGKRWELIEDDAKAPIKEEVAKAICKYVFNDEEAFHKLKARPKTRYSELSHTTLL